MSSPLDRTVNWCSLCCWTLFPQWSCCVKTDEKFSCSIISGQLFLCSWRVSWARGEWCSLPPSRSSSLISLSLSVSVCLFFCLASLFSDGWSATHIQCEQETDGPTELIRCLVHSWLLDAFYSQVVIFGQTDLKEYFKLLRSNAHFIHNKMMLSISAAEHAHHWRCPAIVYWIEQL